MQIHAIATKRKQVRWVVAVLLFDGAIQSFGAEENTGQGVVVFGRDGIELVIVALRAGDGDRKESAGGDIDLVIDDLHAIGHSAGVVPLGSK